MTTAVADALDDIVGRFGGALGERLDEFRDAWGGVAERPGSLSVRAALLTAAGNLAGTINAFSAALRELPDEPTQAYRAALDALADALADPVDSAQTAGYDLAGHPGGAMFARAGAYELVVALIDPSAIAASSRPGAGLDNRTADAVAQGALLPGSAESIAVALVGNVAAGCAAVATNERTSAAVRSYTKHFAAPAYPVDDAAVRAAADHLLAAIDGTLAPPRSHTGRADAPTGPAVAAEQAAAARLSTLQRRLAARTRITRPSDDPDGAAAAIALRSALRRQARYATAIDDALGRLDVVDAAYAQVVSALRSGRIDAVLTGVNTVHQGRPVFGGATAGPRAYDDSGSYVGDTGAVVRTVAPFTTVDIAICGPAVFGELFGDVYADPRKRDTAIVGVQAARDAAADLRERVRSTAAAQRLSTVTLRRRLQTLDEIDVADIAARVASVDVAYRSALQTLGGVDRVSLFDFLR